MEQINKPEELQVADFVRGTRGVFMPVIAGKISAAASLIETQYAKIQEIEGQRTQELHAYELTVSNFRAKVAALEASAPQAVQPAVPDGWKLIAVNPEFDTLMFRLESYYENGYLGRCADLIEPWIAFDYDSTTNFLAATQPTAQGLDAQTIKHISALSELVRMPNAEYFADAHNAAVRHLRAIAAQTKQGEQA